MAQWVNVLAIKSDEVSSISRMHTVGETKLPQVHHGKHVPHGYHGKHVPQIHWYFIFNYVFVCRGYPCNCSFSKGPGDGIGNPGVETWAAVNHPCGWYLEVNSSPLGEHCVLYKKDLKPSMEAYACYPSPQEVWTAE